MSTTFVHTADLHLSQDQPHRLDVLRWIVSYCREISAHLIIAGDFFESDIEASFLRPRVREILRDAPGRVLLISGNHDRGSYGTDVSYGAHAVVLRAESPRTVIEGIEVVGVPFAAEADFSGATQDLGIEAGADILVAHGTFYDKGRPAVYLDLGDDAKYMPIFPWDVKDKARYVALGHYHSRYTQFRAGSTCIVYPGSPVATSSRCVGPRKIAVVSFEDRAVRLQQREVEITGYWEQKEWMVLPGKESEVLDSIEADLARLRGPRVQLVGRVLGSASMNEIEFRRRLQAIEDRHRSGYKQLRLTSQARYWRELLEIPTLRLFAEKLTENEADGEVKERALELVLAALEKIHR